MAIQSIASGDSLICEAVVPAQLGSIAEMLIDAAAERHGQVAQRIRLAGSIVSIDYATRVVRVAWPMGQLRSGVWRVQVRATTLAQVSTFVLDEYLVVEASLLPPQVQIAVARLRIPRLGMRAASPGAVSQATAVLRLPRLGLSARGAGDSPVVATARLPRLGFAAQGPGAEAVGVVTARLPRLGLRASGSAIAVGVATARLPRLGAKATGDGLLPEGVVTARLPRLGLRASGIGGIGEATAVVRLPRLGLSATAENLGPPPRAVFGWEDNELLLGWADNESLEHEDEDG